MRQILRFAILPLVAALAPTACGDDDKSTTTNATTAGSSADSEVPSTAATDPTVDDEPAVTSPTSSSTSVAPDGGFTIDEEMTPGTYQSQNFVTPFSFTVPPGWEVFEDEPGQFGLDVVAHPAPPLLVIRNVAAASTECLESPQPGVDTTAAAITDWLANLDGVIASEPAPASVGGLDGVMIDVSMDPAWTKGCPFSGGEPTVPTLASNAPESAGFLWGVGTDSSQRVYLLDVDEARGGGNILVLVEGCCGVTREARIAESTPVIESIQF